MKLAKSEMGNKLLELENILQSRELSATEREQWAILASDLFSTSEGSAYKRRSFRIPAKALIQIQSDTQVISCQLGDLSWIGLTAFGEGCGNVRAGSNITVKNTQLNGKELTLNLEGKVVWSRTFNSYPAVGVEFGRPLDNEAYEHFYYPLYINYLQELSAGSSPQTF